MQSYPDQRAKRTLYCGMMRAAVRLDIVAKAVAAATDALYLEAIGVESMAEMVTGDRR